MQTSHKFSFGLDGDLRIWYDDGTSELLEDNEVGDMPFKSFRELFASYPREAVDCIVFHEE